MSNETPPEVLQDCIHLIIVDRAMHLTWLFKQLFGDHPEFPAKIVVDNAEDAEKIAKALTNLDKSTDMLREFNKEREQP